MSPAIRTALGRLRFEVERRAASRILASSLACQALAGWRARPIDGRHVAPELAALLRLAELSGVPRVASLTPEEARRDLARSVRLLAEPRPHDVDARDLVFAGPASRLRVRAYVPRARGAHRPAILYLHGGGWVTGNVDVYDTFCARLAAVTGASVFSLDYRLAPEHRFPAQPDDCVAAWRWLASQADALGLDRTRLAVAGDSAGGSLAAVVAQETASDAVSPALQVLIYPSLDATFAASSHNSLRDGFLLTRESIDWYLAHYAGPSPDTRHPRLSPLLATDPMPQVPALIYTAGFDPLRDEGRAYAARLRAAGVAVHDREFSDMVHGFVLVAGIARGPRRATDEVRTTIARVIHARDISTAVASL
jgi:acetyl esterase